MKKILLSIVAASMTLAACNAQSGFKITANVQGLPATKAALVAFENNKVDTLATADVANGAFELSGKVNGIQAAYIVFPGQQGGIPVMLENTNITVSADQTGLKIEAGEAQKLFNQFSEINQGIMQEQMRLNGEYQAAGQAQDQAKMQAIQEEFGKIVEAAQAKELELLKANADSYVAAYVIASAMGQMEFDQLKERYALLGANAKATTHGKAIAEQIAKQEKTAVGQIAPNFTVTTPEGESISLYDIKGKVKLVDFWASWCGPCRGENPNVVALYKEYQPKGLEIFGVSLDNDKAKWVEAIKADGLIWKHGSDLKGWQAEPAKLFSISSIPATLLLDENNKIIAKNLRGEELKQKVAELLK